MRKNRTKHEAKKPRLAKRALALCFALIFVCSCLLPAFANSEAGALTDPLTMVEEQDEQKLEDSVPLNEGGTDSTGSNEQESADNPTEGNEQNPPANNPTEGNEQNPPANNPTEGNEQQPTEPEQPKNEEPKTEGTTESKDSAEQQGNEQTKPEEPKTEETKPEGTTEEQPKNEGTPEEPKTEETKPEQQPTNTTGDTIEQGKATYTYRFWPDKIDAFDLEAINDAVKSGETLNDAAQSRTGMVPCTVLTVMTNANLRDYQANVQQPTKDGYEFAGWYTVDGTTEDKFSFEQNLNFEESETIDVFAKWEKVESTVEDEMEKTEPTTEDELEKTESGKANESKEETLLPVEGAVGLTNNDGDTVSIAVKAENLPGKVNELVVTDLNEDEEGAAFGNALAASSYKDWNVTNLMVNITPKDAEGKTVQPSGTVRVTISDLSQLSIGTESIGEWKVLHLTKNNEIEALNAENTTTAVDSYGNTVLNSITFETTSFSPFVVVAKGKVVKTLDLNSLKLSITDNVKKNGRLVLNITDSNGNEVTTQQLLDGGAKIKWYRNGTEMLRKIVTHGATDIYNMAADNSWVNVAADSGSGVTYKVTVTEGTTVLEKSKTVNQYNTELKNGSFEEHTVVLGSDAFWGMEKVKSDGYWSQTTGTYELANTTYTYPYNTRNYNSYGYIEWYDGYKRTLNAYGCETAADRSQFAELNGDSAGTLYQNVIVTPGTTMYWQFYHRMRKYTGTGDYRWSTTPRLCRPIPTDKGDMMVMIIGPLEWAETIKDQTDVNNFIAGKMTNGWYNAGDNDEYKVYVYFHNTKNQNDWDRVSGQIQVPDDWGAVRFFFGAVSTGCGNPTVGNLLDAVHFSTTPNPVPAGDGQITVTKNIYGMTLEEVKQNLSGANKAFIEYQGDLSGSIYFNAGDWTLRTDGYGKQYVTATATVDITGIQPGSTKTLAFSENEKAKVNGYDLASEWAEKKQNATVGRNDTDNTSSVTVTNTYTPNTLDIKITKNLTTHDASKKFTFKVTGDNLGNENKRTLVDENGKQLTRVDGFEMSHGKTVTLKNVEAGMHVNVTEFDRYDYDVTATNYSTPATPNAGGEKTFNYEVVLRDGKLVLVDTATETVVSDNHIYVTNTPATTSLTVTKATKKDGVADNNNQQEFEFTLTLGDNSKNVTWTKGTEHDAVRDTTHKFTLKGGESIIFSGINVNDNVTVAEKDYTSEHYTTTVNGEERREKTIDSATLKYNQTTGTTVHFVNEYTTPKLDSMTIQKKVTGAFGERTKEFAFSVTLTKDGKTAIGVNHSTVNGTGLSSFKLKHGQQVELNEIPIDTIITITETDANEYKTSATGHSKSVTGSSARTFTYKVVDEGGKAVLKSLGDDSKPFDGTAITVTNDFDGNPDTGVLLDTLPYLILLAVAVAGGVLVVVRKHKHRDE